MFKALRLNQQDGNTTAEIVSLNESALPDGEVTVAVAYSSLNYKDALAITGKGKVIRDFPMVPGIDFSGRVIDSRDPRYQVGDPVILTGWGVGETHWGGLAEKARVKGDWLVPMPDTFDIKRAMAVGTAGLTAMLCIDAIRQRGVNPTDGPILVTGASGGVGSIAVTLLSQLGYRVTAATGRAETNGTWLKTLGATEVIARAALNQPAKPLEKARWAGVIDTVGSQILAKALSQAKANATVAICGLAGGMDLPTTVAPFILRGVALIGIDSVHCPVDKRIAAWQQIAALLPENYYTGVKTIALSQCLEYAEKLIAGKITGRLIVKL